MDEKDRTTGETEITPDTETMTETETTEETKTTEEAQTTEENLFEKRLTSVEEKIDQLIILCRNMSQRDIPVAEITEDVKPERMFL